MEAFQGVTFENLVNKYEKNELEMEAAETQSWQVVSRVWLRPRRGSPSAAAPLAVADK